MIWISPKRRLPLVLALLVGLVVIGVIINHAHGPKPAAGATYTGTVYVETAAGKVTQRLPIAFGVSASGQQVASVRFSAGLPRACAAATLGSVTVPARSTPIRTPSRFELNLAITGSGRQVGTLEISGIFHTLNRESGAVAVHYSPPALRGCDATGGYTTKVDS
jgi:hypothetical protein